jgi:hypothetical protein
VQKSPDLDNAPGPVHGRPVSGFVLVVLDRSPVGVAGETASSDRAGKTVYLTVAYRCPDFY